MESEGEGESAPAGPLEPLTIKLRVPIQFGKDTLIDELVMKPNARAFKDFTIPMGQDGAISYQPYKLALVGLKMAGHIAAAPNLVDKMDPRDMNEVAQAVLGFLS